jgi:hypothetical protein
LTLAWRAPPWLPLPPLPPPTPQDRQADALREKLALRMEHAPGGPREWRWLAFCLGQVGVPRL